MRQLILKMDLLPKSNWWPESVDRGRRNRSERRRLMTILRVACRVLGVKRRRALGMPGLAVAVALALAIGPMQQASAASSGDGIFINPGHDAGCALISMNILALPPLPPAIPTLARSTRNDCLPTTKSTQTDHVLFYNPISNSSNSLSWR